MAEITDRMSKQPGGWNALLFENTGYEFSKTVKSANNSKWFDQYKKLVSNSILAYSDQNNRQSFFTEAARLESLVAKNPRAWNKFINSNVATRILSSKVSILFKNLGANSKALSQSLKSLNLNSPYWSLIEPALEFALYQFGLFLENPKAFNLETPEQKMIKDLKGDEIAPRKEFIKNNGEFTVNIALIENNNPIIGVIFVPAKSTLYFAQKEYGSFSGHVLAQKLSNIIFTLSAKKRASFPTHPPSSVLLEP